jgi:hypothetical protein
VLSEAVDGLSRLIMCDLEHEVLQDEHIPSALS